MPLVVYTENGSNAGWKTQREPRKTGWRCVNGHDNKANHRSCMTAGCREKRG
jgi:hypothetical protein